MKSRGIKEEPVEANNISFKNEKIKRRKAQINQLPEMGSKVASEMPKGTDSAAQGPEETQGRESTDRLNCLVSNYSSYFYTPGFNKSQNANARKLKAAIIFERILIPNHSDIKRGNKSPEFYH